MAEQEAQALGSAFPNPPSFWRDFTADKIARMDELRKSYTETLPEAQQQTQQSGDDTEGGSSGPTGADEAAAAAAQAVQNEVPVRIPDVPEDLVNLQPPAEPEDGRWRVFGDYYMVRHLSFERTWIRDMDGLGLTEAAQ